jgi:hypothetical protein
MIDSIVFGVTILYDEYDAVKPIACAQHHVARAVSNYVLGDATYRKLGRIGLV